MATITNSEVIINRPDISNFNRRIREKHTTSLGTDYIRTLNYTFTTDPADYIGNDAGYQAALAAEYAPVLAQHAIDKADQLGEQEIQVWIQQMEQGLDPWHSAPYINVTPDWNTWDTAASESLKHWLLKEDMQELLNCQLSISSTSNNDIDALLVLCGSTFSRTDLTSNIQIAVNTQITLDAYSPSVVE